MFAGKLFVALAAAVIVSAQSSSAADPTSTAGIDPCVLGCVTSAATSSGCSSITNITCICTSETFQSAALQCLQSTCTSADVAAASALQAEECGSLSASGASGSATATSASGSGSSPASGSSSGSSSAATTSASSAASSIVTLGMAGVYTIVAGFAGILVGAIVV